MKRPCRRRALRGLVAPLALFAGCGLVACQHTPKAAAESPRARAEALLEAGKSDEAIGVLQRLHEDAPEDLDLARLLAEANVRAGRVTPFLEALSRQPPSPSRHYMRALVLFSQSADATPEAISAIDAALELTPRQAELHYRKGLMLLEAERFEAALAPLDRAHALAPERVSWLLPLAKARARNGDLPGAVEALRKLVAARPTPAQVETARGLMDELSNPYRAVPRAAEGRLEEGIAWLQRYDAPQQAIIQFEDILREFPDLALVHALLGLAYQRLDDAGRAVDAFRQAIALDPAHGRFHFYLAQIYLARSRPEQARAALEAAVRLDPLLGEAYHALGDLAFERRELDAARAHFQFLVSLEPDSPPARGKLATLQQLQGDYGSAEEHLRAILAKDPENLEFIHRLGNLFLAKAQAQTAPEARRAAKEEAVTLLSRVLERAPQNAEASSALEAARKL